MSALFVADGRRARRVGLNELIVRPLGALPHVYRGAVGPVALPAALTAAIDAALDALAAHFALRDLASLDFLRVGDGWSLLEVNPRPSASMALYGGLMRAHVEACVDARLPPVDTAPPGEVRGCERVLVDFYTAGAPRCEYATTLGAGGLFIETEEPLAPGTVLRVRFRLPGGQLLHAIDGRVKWQHRLEDARAGDLRPRGMGIAFTDAAAAAQLAVELERLADA